MAKQKWGKYASIETKTVGYYLKGAPDSGSRTTSAGRHSGYIFDAKTGAITMTGSSSGFDRVNTSYSTSNFSGQNALYTYSPRYSDEYPDDWTQYKDMSTRYTYMVYSKGEYIADIIADENTYPADGRHSDGFWYVTLGLLPPTAPETLTVPTPVRGGKTVKTSWSAATSEGSSIAGYELEKAVDGGEFIQIYKGISTSFTDNILYGSTSVQYQVRAYDATNTYSGYTTSERLTVVNNNPPTISGTDEDKGLIMTDGFTYPYTVDDADSEDTVTVVEAIDGVPIRTYTAVKAVENTAAITGSTWIEVLNGIHRLTITVTDSRQAAVVRTISFSKLVSEIEFTLAVPLPADDMITKTILGVTKELPVGADFSVFICNNGNDAAPTWEDVTQSVLGNDKFFFTNEVKTAEAWGYNFKVCIKRKGTVANLYGKGFDREWENQADVILNLQADGYCNVTTKTAETKWKVLRGLSLAKNELKPNTQYTVILDVTENNLLGDYLVDSDDTDFEQPLGAFKDKIAINKTNGIGVFKFTLTTADVFVDTMPTFYHVMNQYEAGISSITLRTMLLEGDWTNKSLPSNYWEDMSVDISADCFVNSVGGVFE